MSRSSASCVAGFDSASAMVHAVANFLHGQNFPALGQNTQLRPLAIAANALPKKLREVAYAWSGWAEATSPKKLINLQAEELARWAVHLYPQRRYPAVVIGSSSGALVHLCSALQIPFLPQTLLVPVRMGIGRSVKPKKRVAMCRQVGHEILRNNPELQLHQMHDPNQDHLMLQHMEYFRFKRLQLGEAYKQFLKQVLEPGGTIILSECGLTWPVTSIADRYTFQFGALGGMTAEEYRQGGPRVQDFLSHYNIPQGDWEDPPAVDCEAPEAEWGFAPALREDAEDFARKNGYTIARLTFDAPEQLSPLVSDFYRSWNRQRDIPSNRLLVESFILFEPWWTLRLGAVPFWMTFNTEPSADSLEKFLNAQEDFDEIYMMLFSHGTESIGLASIDRWRNLLKRARKTGKFVGVDETRYPRDFAVFGRYQSALKNISGRFPMPEPFPFRDCSALIQKEGKKYGIRWLEKAYGNVASVC
jgi:hypothetical protein